MTPIERAARALCALEARAEEAPITEADWRRHVPQVMAVIDALHEPSPWMAEAGAEIVRHIRPEESIEAYQGDAANIWRLMLDAIRKDIP